MNTATLRATIDTVDKEQFVEKFSYPCVLLKNGPKLEIIIESEKMNSLESLSQLMDLVKEKTKGYV